VSTAPLAGASDDVPLDDAELAHRIAAAGDSPDLDAEAELCRRFGRRLLAFGRRLLGSGDAARDLAQDALLLTLEKLRAGEVREPEKIGAFILGVARSLASRRRGKEARWTPIGDAGGSLVAPSVAPPDPIARARVSACLDELPETGKSVLLLTFYAEQASGAIASSLGLSPENVRVIRHRSVARLRDCLDLAGTAA
jgi:RNA polymerase sigma-70 factor (ECF subfamily)